MKKKIGVLATAAVLAMSGGNVSESNAHGTWTCAHASKWLSPGAMYLKYSGRYRSGSSDIHVYTTIGISPTGVQWVIDTHKRICGTWH